MSQAALVQRTQTLIPLHDTNQMHAHGLPFETEHQARWMFRTRDEKGLTAAFVRIGRCIFVDPDKFHELARNPELKPQPAPKKGQSTKGRR